MRFGGVIVTACAAGIAVALLLAWDVDEAVELPLRDAALRLLPGRAATATAIVAIDELSLRQQGPWPWPRPMIADLVDRIADAGARGLVIDVILADPRSGDERLASAMRRLPTVVVAAVDDRGEWLLPSSPIREAAVVAHGTFELDNDGIVRRLAATKQNRDRSLAALSIQAAAITTPMSIAAGRVIVPAFRTAPSGIPLVSAADVMQDHGAVAVLRGRIVFVGPTALAFGDRVLTPVSGQAADTSGDVAADLGPAADAGVTVHAAATESLVRGELIRDTPPLVSGAAAAMAVACLLLTRRSRKVRLLTMALLVALITSSALFLLARSGVAVPLFTLLMTVVATAVAVEAAQIAATWRKSDAAARRIENDLGLARARHEQEVGSRLQDIAQMVATHQEREAESKRILAHELKTPLASMRGLSQLLAGYSLSDAERQRVAALLESEAGKLQSIVHALLDLERLPLRDFAAAARAIDLGELVRRRVEFLQAGTGRDIRVAVSPGTVVLGDAALIDRIVDNLVGNALKYTPVSSPVLVTVRPAEDQVALEVEDRGPGIAEGERERVFQRFFRGASAAGTEGLGLGLSFVAEITKWHGGTVSMTAANGGGSLFRVTLPVATAMARAGGM